jgi:hypothetical protein
MEMRRIMRRWLTATILVLLHAVAFLATTVWFYTSRDPERIWIWVYGFFASYPSSLLVRFLPQGSDAALGPALLVVGTLQWGIIGVIIDAIIHRARRAATPDI